MNVARGMPGSAQGARDRYQDLTQQDRDDIEAVRHPHSGMAVRWVNFAHQLERQGNLTEPQRGLLRRLAEGARANARTWHNSDGGASWSEHRRDGRRPRRQPEPPPYRSWRQVLGVNGEADMASVKAAFRKLVLQHHPDRGGDPARMRELSDAYSKARRELGG